jgi:hypothetical protein
MESRHQRIVRTQTVNIPAPESPATHVIHTYTDEAPAGYRVVSHSLYYAEDVPRADVASVIDYGHAVLFETGTSRAYRVAHRVVSPVAIGVTFQTIFERSDEPDVVINPLPYEAMP